MFDFAWSEIALIAAVALIAIGPKDMPVAIRSITDMIKKARRMASEFQTHVDEMVREANLDEVRNQINELRSFNVRAEIEKAVDPDGSLRSTFASNPLEPTPAISMPPPGEPAAAPLAMGEAGLAELVRPGTDSEAGAEPERHPAAKAGEAGKPYPPAFIPPNAVPPEMAAVTAAEHEEAPAFIPPEAVLQRRSRPSA